MVSALPFLGLSGLAVPFFLPPPLLLLTPAISASFALQWVTDEYQFLSSWLDLPTPTPADSHRREQTLLEWFPRWFPRGGSCAALIYPTIYSSSALCIYRTRHLDWTSSKGLFVAGLALFVAHVPVGGGVFPKFKALSEGKGGLMELKDWCDTHWWRTVAVDVPAWACLLAAGVMAVQAK